MDIFSDPKFLPLIMLSLAIFVLSSVLFVYKRITRPKRTIGSVYPRLGRSKFWLFVSAVSAFLVLALARPQTELMYSVSRSGCADIVVMLDMSVSMRAEDILPDRLTTAKREIFKLESDYVIRECDRVALFTFDQNSRAKLPLSSDFNKFIDQVARARTGGGAMVNEAPWYTDLIAVIEHVPTVIDRQNEFFVNELGKPASEGRGLVVILFTDGDDDINNHHQEELARALGEYKRRNIPIYSVGVGTRAGYSKVEIVRTLWEEWNRPRDPRARRLLRDREKEWAGEKTRLETRTLSYIAQQTKGDIFLLDDASKSTREFLQDAVNSVRYGEYTVEPIVSENGRELWWYLVVAALGLIALAILFY